MQLNCPNCNSAVQQHRPPAKNDPEAGEAWVCFRCPSVVCVCCYVSHNEGAHPEVYGLKSQPTGGSKKKQKGKKR